MAFQLSRPGFRSWLTVAERTHSRMDAGRSWSSPPRPHWCWWWRSALNGGAAGLPARSRRLRGRCSATSKPQRWSERTLQHKSETVEAQGLRAARPALLISAALVNLKMAGRVARGTQGRTGATPAPQTLRYRRWGDGGALRCSADCQVSDFLCADEFSGSGCACEPGKLRQLPLSLHMYTDPGIRLHPSFELSQKQFT